MNYSTKKHFIETLLMTTVETVEKQESLFRRGLITDTEKITEVTAIINKVAEMITEM